MSKYLIFFLMLALLVESCAPASIPPSPTLLPTATVPPTITPSPAPSATPTAVPRTNEHLIVTRDLQHWAILNADGSLQKYIQPPDIAGPHDVSPDGKWVAGVAHGGSTRPKDAPQYKPNGMVVLYQFDGDKLTKVSEAPIGAWSQGASFLTRRALSIKDRPDFPERLAARTRPRCGPKTQPAGCPPATIAGVNPIPAGSYDE